MMLTPAGVHCIHMIICIALFWLHGPSSHPNRPRASYIQPTCPQPPPIKGSRRAHRCTKHCVINARQPCVINARQPTWANHQHKSSIICDMHIQQPHSRSGLCNHKGWPPCCIACKLAYLVASLQGKCTVGYSRPRLAVQQCMQQHQQQMAGHYLPAFSIKACMYVWQTAWKASFLCLHKLSLLHSCPEKTGHQCRQ
jgi:hypothetical protein